MAAQASALQIVEETHQAEPSQDAGQHRLRMTWFLQGVGLAALMISGFAAIGCFASGSENPSGHAAAFAFLPAMPGRNTGSKQTPASSSATRGKPLVKSIVEETHHPQLDYQKIPPVKIDGMDSKWLLNNWADHSLREASLAMRASDDTAVVLNSMRSQVNIFLSLPATMPRLDRDRLSSLLLTTKRLELVGLVPQRRPQLVPQEHLALGVFSREKFKDDSTGTLRKKSEFYRPRPKVTEDKDFDVFALQGLAAHPGSSDHSAEAHVLLYKIGLWADEEQNLLVVPEWACKSIGGKDLTDYYVGFGFQKVEMDDGSYVLVYEGVRGRTPPLIQYGNTYETAATIPGKIMISMAVF